MSIWQQPIGNTQLKKPTNRTSSSISNRIPPQPPRHVTQKLNYFCELTRTDRHDLIESNPPPGWSIMVTGQARVGGKNIFISIQISNLKVFWWQFILIN